MTFVNFGLKNVRDFPALYREHGINSFVKDPSLAAQYDSPEGLARLQAQLNELYHTRHSAVVIGDTIGDPFKDTSGPVSAAQRSGAARGVCGGELGVPGSMSARWGIE